MSEKAATAESPHFRCVVGASPHPRRLSVLIVGDSILSEQLEVPDQALCCAKLLEGSSREHRELPSLHSMLCHRQDAISCCRRLGTNLSFSGFMGSHGLRLLFPSLDGRLQLDTKLSLDLKISLGLCARKGCGRRCSAEWRGSNNYVSRRARRIR